MSNHEHSRRALDTLQRQLGAIYDVALEARVGDFICDAAAVADATGGEAEAARGEVFVLVEEGADVHVGLYVEPEALERLTSAAQPGWTREHLGSYCLALEGVSHFVYWMFRAAHRDAVSQLELELQAEVDKFASLLVHEGAVGTTPALLEGNGVPLIRSRAIRRRLFGEMSLLDDPQSERGARYRDAHRHAARYAEFLEARFVARGDFPGLLAELRRFYRMGLGAKLQSAGTD